MMKRYISLFILLWSVTSYGQIPFDGPYVRHSGNKVIVSTIMQDEDRLIVKTDTLDKQGTINVTPQGHLEWSFTVKLRDTLINDPDTYNAPDKTLFISDIEGEFANFRKLLLAAGVTDKKYNWTFGKNALVIPGDLFDRGKDVGPELWLLYKLEDEAKAAGGSVEVILGNHDIMNLAGDHRYTDAKYFKDAWLLHTDINGLFTADTELGRWLRSKNVIEKCGDVLVMHGGLSPAILKLGLSINQLNGICQLAYGVPQKGIKKGIALFFGKDALFWYRGYFMSPRATKGLVDTTLRFYHCKYILVGHTIVRWNIASYYGGKVIGVDVDEHSGHTEAAIYENGRWSTIDEKGQRKPLRYKPTNDLVNEKDIL